MAKKPLKGFPKSDSQKMLDRLSSPVGVRKLAQGGFLVPAQLSILRPEDRKWRDTTKSQLEEYTKSAEAFNAAREKYLNDIYNPYLAKATAFDKAADAWNKAPETRTAISSIYNQATAPAGKYIVGHKSKGRGVSEYIYADIPTGFELQREGGGRGGAKYFLAGKSATHPGAAPTAPVEFTMQKPAEPTITQEQINARMATAQKLAARDAANRGAAISAVNDPSQYNLAGFGMAGTNAPTMFREGGEVEQESTASRMLKEVVPLDTRTFVSTLFGNRDPITEKNLNADQLSALREVVQTAEQKGRQGNVQYSDYEKFNAGPQHNAHISLSTTLGRFNYVQNPDGSLTVVDRYDFANPGREEAIKAYEGMGPARKALEVAKRTAQKPLAFPLSLASELGNAYIGREGRDVKIQVPPSESKKMLDGVKKPPKK
jgi:hypothetical protein